MLTIALYQNQPEFRMTSLRLHRDAFEHDPLNSDHYYRIALKRYQISDPEQLISEIDTQFIDLISHALSKPSGFSKEKFLSFPLETVLQYLEKTHILYLQKYLPEISQSIHLIRKNDDERNPYLEALDLLYMDYKQHLAEHIQEEETELFPHIKYLIGVSKKEIPIHFHQIDRSYDLRRFLHEHSDEEIDLKVLRRTLGSYEPSTSTKSLYRVLFSQLINLEMDLKVHGRIEEEVLIPKALELQNR